MARSWQYPRWRRVVEQVVLWAIFGLSLGLAALVVRHKRLVGSVDLADPRGVDLPGGVRVGVRLPTRWLVSHDAAEHDPAERDGGESGAIVQLFQADEPAGGVGTPDPDAAAGTFDRQLLVRCETVPAGGAAPVTPQAYLERSGLLANTISLAGAARGRAGPASGTLPVAGVDGYWVAVGRRVRAAPGLGPAYEYEPEYVAAGVVPLRPPGSAVAAPGSLVVAVTLSCPPGGPDPAGDQDLLRRVTAAITVSVDPGRPTAGRDR